MCDDRDDYCDDLYQNLEDIDFSRIQSVFRTLALFDDVFLNMQAINISIVDSFVTEQEYALLHEYIEIERTPVATAMFVSAQSQMWIFALYELLRTWRQRIRKLQSWSGSGAIPTMLKRLEADRHNFAAHMRARHLRQVLENPSVLELMNRQVATVDPVYRMTEAIRVNLAKHEVRGKENMIVRAPGYGRINMFCGAMDYELDLGDNSYQTINRRDIADALRKLTVPIAQAE